jgi:hypothetical protein
LVSSIDDGALTSRRKSIPFRFVFVGKVMPSGTI